MKKNCYALFIAVNEYSDTQIPNLSACIHDAERLLAYIQKNINSSHYDLKVLKLFSNSDTLPTRKNIIEGIRQHLGAAKAGDMALLFYSGHGSTEKAHPYFGEADGNVQSLVPCDARTKDANGHLIKNIIDKEIRYLLQSLWTDIDELSRKPDLIFIQDSCHATGATRKDEQLKFVQESIAALDAKIEAEEGIVIPKTVPVARYTNPTDYEKSGSDWTDLNEDELAQLYTAFDNEEQPLKAILENLNLGKVAFDLTFPMAQHIHLAACDKHQYAYEIPFEGGVFTSNLLAILEASQNTISYQDVYSRARTNIDGVFEQTPDLFIHHHDLMKRHETFLGDLLKKGSLPPYRDVDVFKGFYPIIPKDAHGWQMPIGELKLLPTLDGKIKSIPIEIFLQDEKPKGLTNAQIVFVGSDFCLVEFDEEIFDREKHANQLYAMIPPRYMRRWRVSAAVVQQVEGHIKDLFKHYIIQSPADIYKQGNIAILSDVPKAAAQFSIKSVDGNLALYKGEGQLVKQGSNQDIIPIIEALKPIFTKTRQAIKVYFESSSENAFVSFQKEQEKTIAYYNPFINWTTEDKAEYLIKTDLEGFAVYSNTNPHVPVFRKTKGTAVKQGLQIILSLQKMCKWKTVKALYNKVHRQTLAAHQFDFQFKLYTEAIQLQPNPNRSFTPIAIQSWNAAHFANEEQISRGETLALEELSKQKLHFLNHDDFPSIHRLDMELDIVHLQGDQNVYVACLLLDSNFGILPLQKEQGYHLLPPKSNNNSSKGTLQLKGIEIPRPAQFSYSKDKLPAATFYIKIFIAYRKFDISGFLQAPLPAPHYTEKDKNPARDNTRLMKRPIQEDTGKWMSFTIPFTVHQV